MTFGNNNMEQAKIKRRYEEMLKTIESANMYDGRDTYDLYECKECGCKKITTYKDKGVTPFMLPCPCSESWMEHTKTFKSIPDGTTVEEFVRPSLEIAYKMKYPQLEHLFNGGLFLKSDLVEICHCQK